MSTLTRGTTRLARRSAMWSLRRAARMALAFAAGCLFGWWWDRQGMVKDRALESPFERRAQVSSAVFWPTVAIWVAAGAPGCPGLVAALASWLGADVMPRLVWVIGVTFFAVVVLMRRLMAMRGYGWRIRSLVGASRRWLGHYPALAVTLAVVCGVMPAWALLADWAMTPLGAAVPTATLLATGAFVAWREGAWRRRVERLQPALAQAHHVTEAVLDNAVFMPRRRGLVMVVVPPAVVDRLGELPERIARHLPQFQAEVHRNPDGAVTSVTYRPTDVEERTRRQVRADSRELIAAVNDTYATLADGVTESRAEEVNQALHDVWGLSIVEWDKGARRVRHAALDERTLEIRAAIVREMGLRAPWDVEVTLTADEDGNVVEMTVPRSPGLGGPAKRRETWTRLATLLLPRHSTRVWRFEDDPDSGGVRLVLVEDTLANGFTIGRFMEEHHDHSAGLEKSWMSYPVALREDGTPLRYNLFHTLVTGQTGAGKGSVIWSIVAGLLPAVRAGLVELYAIDPKAGEAPMAENLFKQVALTPEEWDPMLEDMVHGPGGLKERQAARAGRGRETPVSKETPARVLIVDEGSALKKFETDAARAKAVNANLLLIASQGRSEGYSIIMCVQGPQKDLVGEVREFMGLRVGLRTASRIETDIVLGDGAAENGALSHEIEPANKGNGYRTAGTAYMLEDGSSVPARIRFPFTSDADLERWNEEYAPAPSCAPAPASPAPSAPAPVADTNVRDLGEVEVSLDDLNDEVDEFEAPAVKVAAKHQDLSDAFD